MTVALLATLLGLAGAPSAGAISIPLIANDDSYLLQRGTTLTVLAPGVMANDVTGGATGLHILGRLYDLGQFSTCQPPTGEALIRDDGSLVCTPDPGLGGDLWPIQYTFADSAGRESNWATITITAILPPVANPDTYTIPENGTLTIPEPGILANDSSPAFSPPRTLVVNTDGYLSGSPTDCTEGGSFIQQNGRLTCTPPAGYVGDILITYTAAAVGVQNSLSDATTVTIHVIAPTATPKPGATATPRPGATATAKPGTPQPGTTATATPSAGQSDQTAMGTGSASNSPSTSPSATPTQASGDSGVSTPFVILLVVMALLVGGLGAALALTLRRRPGPGSGGPP
jgi:hypothetical protein